MKIHPLTLTVILVLSSCRALPASPPSQRDIYNAAMKEVDAHREIWSHDSAGNNPIQNPRDGTWVITVGKIDMRHTLIDIPTPAFLPGTVRELRFSRDGALISYKKSPISY